jgi:hypothetical protein
LSVGEAQTVLSSPDQCTSVFLMTPMGGDLLVGVEDTCAGTGRSLAVLRRQP